jgi:hypothetical protein
MFNRRKKKRQLDDQMTPNVEASSKALVGLADFISTLDEALEDRKIQLTEWPQLATSGISLARSLRDWEDIKIELSDLSQEEKNLLVQAFLSEFDLRNDVAEQVIVELGNILISIGRIQKTLKQ